MTKVELKTPITIENEQFDSVAVFVHHREEDVVLNDKHSLRHTVVEIKAGDHLIVSATAHCYEPDNFCRSEGRRRSLATCFRQDTQLTTENRKVIFDAICPEFATSRLTDRKRAKIATAALQDTREQLKVATAALQEIVSGERGLGPARAAEALKQLGVVAVANDPVVRPLGATDALARARSSL